MIFACFLLASLAVQSDTEQRAILSGGAALGVSVGHSDTVLDWQMPAGADSQPLWWAKGGTLRGLSPARIQWFREQHVAAASQSGEATASVAPSRRPLLPAPGTGIPSTLANGNSAFAQILKSSDGRQHLLHFTRPGRWNVPLPTPATPPTGPPAQLCALMDATNCMGGDIRNGGAVSSAEACCALCSDLVGCAAWSWNKGYTPQSCWLKSGCGGQTKDINVVSGAALNHTTSLPLTRLAEEAETMYEVWFLDFWGMKADLVDTVHGGGAVTVVVDVPDVPYNIQIFAK